LLLIASAQEVFEIVATDVKHIDRAWITIDNQLHLWDYVHPEKCEVYDGLSEIILSVSISAPKPGIFLDTIKYVIAIGEDNSEFNTDDFLKFTSVTHLQVFYMRHVSVASCNWL
jgi:hypothetical protein